MSGPDSTQPCDPLPRLAQHWSPGSPYYSNPPQQTHLIKGMFQMFSTLNQSNQLSWKKECPKDAPNKHLVSDPHQNVYGTNFPVRQWLKPQQTQEWLLFTGVPCVFVLRSKEYHCSSVFKDKWRIIQSRAVTFAIPDETVNGEHAFEVSFKNITQIHF